MEIAEKIGTVHYCVISHTHWDREWYKPFENFRFRLVQLVDNVLDILNKQPGYCFHLDAQTIVLEDYLEIRPHRRAELERHIASRRLLTGPWYVQNDFFLTSGEATIRNLLIGTAMAKRFGHCMNIGYVPDQFGLISQLPQIFNGFGMQECVFGRGYTAIERDGHGQQRRANRPNEFEWRGREGSSVLAVLMSHWYNNAQRFPGDPDRAMHFLNHIHAGLKPNSSTPYLLLMNGVDHLEAQEDLLPILEGLNRGLKDAVIYQTSMEDYLGKLRGSLPERLDRTCGELRQGDDDVILQGTLSSRAYLKRANVKAQALLEQAIEPLHAMLGCMGDAERYPADFLTYLWKMLIRTHPHDNICGCSCDPVHAHMEDTYSRWNECAGAVLRDGLQRLSDRLSREDYAKGDYLLTICNTLGRQRSALITAELTFPQVDKVRGFTIADPTGRAVDFEVVKRERKRQCIITPINLPGEMIVEQVTVRFIAEDLEPLAYRTYTVTPCAAKAALAPAPPAGRVAAAIPADGVRVLENEHLRVRIAPDGRIELTEKSSGQQWADLLALRDEADRGHSYIFIKDPNDTPIEISATAPKIRPLEWTPWVQSIELTWRPSLPESYDIAHGRRSSRRVANAVSLVLRLERGARQLEIEATVDNHSRDHRVRLIVQSEAKTALSASMTPFDLVTRDREAIAANSFREKSQPNAGLVTISDGTRQLALLNEGLYEYEHLDDERGTLALTLLRATGFVYDSKNGQDQPEEWLAPANQSLRRDSFRIAIRPGAAALEDPAAALHEFLVAPLAAWGAVDHRKFIAGRAFVQDSTLNETFHRDLPDAIVNLPREQQAIDLDGAGVQMSAFKRAEAGDRWVVRLYNAYDEPRTARVSFPLGVERAWLLGLDESTREELSLESGAPARALTLALAPKQIVTLGFIPGRE